MICQLDICPSFFNHFCFRNNKSNTRLSLIYNSGLLFTSPILRYGTFDDFSSVISEFSLDLSMDTIILEFTSPNNEGIRQDLSISYVNLNPLSPKRHCSIRDTNNPPSLQSFAELIKFWSIKLMFN